MTKSKVFFNKFYLTEHLLNRCKTRFNISILDKIFVLIKDSLKDCYYLPHESSNHRVSFLNEELGTVIKGQKHFSEKDCLALITITTLESSTFFNIRGKYVKGHFPKKNFSNIPIFYKGVKI